jgi:hypothetical protein
MAAPDLAKRYSAFVSKLGTDDAGNNPLGSPNAWLTIAAALADLAANYEAATAAAPKYISLGAGTYTTPAFALPPNVFIEADPDGAPGSDGEVIISLTGNITLAAAWNANATAIGGFRGVTIRQTTAQNFDLTLPAPTAGTPSRTLIMRDVRLDCDLVNLEGIASGDVANITNVTHDGGTADTFTIEGIVANVEGLRHNGVLTFIDSATRPLVAQVQGLFTPNATGSVVCNSIGAGTTVTMGGCTNRNLTISETAPGVIAVLADAVSIPLAANLSFTGTATNADLTRLNDGGAISPVFSGDVVIGASNFFGWTGRSKIFSPADSVILLQNNAATAFDRLQLGGTTASFPSLQRSTTFLAARLADNSAYASMILMSLIYDNTGGITGVTDNSNAPSGYLGQLISSTVVAGSAVALTTATAANITSISLTAGDWDVNGVIGFVLNAATTVNSLGGSSSSVSATAGALGSGMTFPGAAATLATGVNPEFSIPTQRFALNATTTIYLVALAAFGVNTCAGYGLIRARRIR